MHPPRLINRVAHRLAQLALGPGGLHNQPDDTQERYRAAAHDILDMQDAYAPAAMRHQVVGALRSAVDAHGPITRELIGSAADRICGQLNARISDLEAELAQHKAPCGPGAAAT
jgi:hypothetical protein